MNKYAKPLMTVLLFGLVQMGMVLLVQLAVGFYELLKSLVRADGSLFSIDTFTAAVSGNAHGIITLTVILSGLVTVILLAKPMHMLRLPRTFDVRDVHWDKVLTAVLGCAAGVLALNLLSEQVDLENWDKGAIAGMMGSMTGIFAVGIVGPVVEEAVFREALLGGMLRRGVLPRRAILISALLFGLIHFNPAQVPAACGIGVLLGIVYWKMNNIVLTSLLHMANNLFCVAQYHVLGDSAQDFTLTNWLGGSTVALPVIAFALVLCAWFVTDFIRNYPEAEIPANPNEASGCI